MIKVLFVCLGNICRSPMAQFVFKQMVDERGLSDQFEIVSSSCLTKYTAEIKKLLLSGTPKIKIARKFHVSLSTLWKFLYLKKINLPVPRKLDGKEEQIIQLFKAGISLEKMASELKCHSATLSSKIKELGLKRKVLHRVSQLDKHKEKIEKLFSEGFRGLITNNSLIYLEFTHQL